MSFIYSEVIIFNQCEQLGGELLEFDKRLITCINFVVFFSNKLRQQDFKIFSKIVLDTF